LLNENWSGFRIVAALQMLVVTGVKSRMKRQNKIVDHGTKEWNCRAGEKKESASQVSF
jgi:hypothetical protein